MTTLQFKCTLKTDVVFNQRTSTEGLQQTLDFIPGSAILGLVGSKLYKYLEKEEAMEVFHSGRVQFSDGHPLVKGKRALRTPAAWNVEKGKTLKDNEIFIHHLNSISKQPKQCRSGFVCFDGSAFYEVKPEKNFSIKSGYDSNKRKSEDKQMYGYQSLEAGSEWCFEIVFTDEVNNVMIGKILNSIVGTQQIGKSKTSEYGLVEISEQTFEKCYKPELSDKFTIVYAESRLIFLDDYGLPKYQPTLKDLGFDSDSGKIDWENSQIRTFHYAPFSSTRQTRDADRCGIEKGSVIYINGALKNEKTAVGYYKNEGFGRIIINPDFLSGGDDGKIKYKYTDLGTAENSKDQLPTINENILTRFLRKSKAEADNQVEIYNMVNDFVAKNHQIFSSEKFASQWGTIRAIAAKSTSKNDLEAKLWKTDNSYLVHGVSADKWAESKRLQKVQDFIANCDNDTAIKATINLASEMAKKCKEGKQ